MEINVIFLESVKKQFLYYKTLGDKAISQLEPEQLFVALNDDTNSIAVIVKHLAGNMLSRWTDFLTTDGEKEWRDRDGEFENTLETKSEVLQLWEQGWTCVFDAMNSLQPSQLSDIIYIRNEGHTVLEAINRQLAHYPYHVGQIVFYAKQLKNSEWDSLSIAKNNSKKYNTDKFSEDKIIRHFTDAELHKFKEDLES